jgi:hypothetical protein
MCLEVGLQNLDSDATTVCYEHPVTVWRKILPSIEMPVLENADFELQTVALPE